jgi:thioredoxin reductase (NADPH)
MAQMRAQAERFGAELVTARATKAELHDGGPHTIWYEDPSNGQEVRVRARVAVMAMGARALMLDVPGESRLLGHGVSTCATCDGFFFRGQHIAVVGGGDSAIEEASFLTHFAETVTIVHRRQELRASKIMQSRARANPKIQFAWNSVVEEVLGDGKVEGVRLRDVVTGEKRVLPVTGLFVAIGHSPNSDLVRGQLELDEAGYVVTKGATSETGLDGVFACGDLQDHRYRQAVTAAGSGCMAALDAERWLEARRS